MVGVATVVLRGVAWGWEPLSGGSTTGSPDTAERRALVPRVGLEPTLDGV